MARFKLEIKTPQLKETMFSRAEKPAKVYRIKRKTFGVAEAAQNVIGGTMETAGNIADTKIGGVAGGLAGGSMLGAKIGAALPGMLGFASGPIGWLVGAGLGAAAARGIGKGLKSVGESIKTN